MIERTIEATSISEGWLGACRCLLAAPGHQVTHLVVRLTDPLPEDLDVRSAVEKVLAAEGLQEVDEVRNTIFPAGLAADIPDPPGLAAAYLEDYDVLRAFAGNSRGTYFGRICEYPHPDKSTTPQLVNLVKKLEESRYGNRFRARYEVNIYAEHKDAAARRGFPCLSHLSFQLGGERKDRLDCLALYRAQDMIAKGYGNFLGLAELQEYLATTTGFEPGELTVVAGNALLSKGIRRLRRLADGRP
jgi:thymidylate synthase